MAVCLITGNVNSTTWLSAWLLFLSPAFHEILLAALIKTSLITRTKHFIQFSPWLSAPGANSYLFLDLNLQVTSSRRPSQILLLQFPS